MMMGYSLFYFLLPLLILAALVALGRKSQLGSLAAGELKEAGEKTHSYIENQLQGIPKPHVVQSALGLLLLGLGIYAIVTYLPIYEHILQNALRLSQEQSHSLALLLIISIGLTGILADVTARYGRHTEHGSSGPGLSQNSRGNETTLKQRHSVFNELEGREGDDEIVTTGDEVVTMGIPEEPGPASRRIGIGYVFWVSLLGLIALALLIFQGILYLEFYRSRAAEGSLLPFAFGSAALFISGIEMINFYWATRLAFDFIAWLFVHPFLLAASYSGRESGVARGEGISSFALGDKEGAKYERTKNNT
jgi:hypothetical protein